MSLSIVVNGRVWANEYDLSGNANKVNAKGQAPLKSTLNFDDGGWDSGLAGMLKVSASVNGWYEAAKFDAMADALLAASAAYTLATDSAIGSTAYLSTMLLMEANRGFEVGEVAALDGMAVTKGSVPFVKGILLLPRTTTASGGNGAAQSAKLSAIGSTQVGYGALHVFTAGTNLAVKIQSSADGSSGWTDRITFPTTSAVGGSIGTVAGAVTHTFWRALYTIGAGTPSFGVSFGIL